MYSLDNIYKSFDNNQVLKGVSLEIPKNKTTVLIGPSGSGKTTLLRCINLLEIPDSGTVTLNGSFYVLSRGTESKVQRQRDPEYPHENRYGIPELSAFSSQNGAGKYYGRSYHRLKERPK